MAYAIIIKVPNMPDEEVKGYVSRINDLEGLKGIAPTFPDMLVLFFDTKKEAKRAAKKLKHKGKIWPVKR